MIPINKIAKLIKEGLCPIEAGIDEVEEKKLKEKDDVWKGKLMIIERREHGKCTYNQG